MSIKLITIDIDGTLINSQRQITENVKNALKKAQDKGVKIVLCTGRPLTGVTGYLNELGLTGDDNYVGTYNGSLVQTVSGKIITSHSLTYSNYLEIEAMSRKIFTPLHIHLLNPPRLIATNKDINRYTVHESFMVSLPLSYRTPEDITPEDTIVKMMYINDPEKLDRSLSQLPEDFYEKYTCVRSERFFFEILNKKAGKGQALADLREHLGLKKEETMAIGDNENDLSMIEEAGIGVAMENGAPLVKEKANFVTKNCNEDGVAYALEKFVL